MPLPIALALVILSRASCAACGSGPPLPRVHLWEPGTCMWMCVHACMHVCVYVCMHVACPLVAGRYPVQCAILKRLVVEGDVDGQVGHGAGAIPI